MLAGNSHRQMPEIGNRRVAVLEIEALKKRLGIVRPHPFDGLANGARQPAIARKYVRGFLGRHRRRR